MLYDNPSPKQGGMVWFRQKKLDLVLTFTQDDHFSLEFAPNQNYTSWIILYVSWIPWGHIF